MRISSRGVVVNDEYSNREENFNAGIWEITAIDSSTDKKKTACANIEKRIRKLLRNT